MLSFAMCLRIIIQMTYTHFDFVELALNLAWGKTFKCYDSDIATRAVRTYLTQNRIIFIKKNPTRPSRDDKTVIRLKHIQFFYQHLVTA